MSASKDRAAQEDRGHAFAEGLWGLVNTLGPAEYGKDERDELAQALFATTMATVRMINVRRAKATGGEP